MWIGENKIKNEADIWKRKFEKTEEREKINVNEFEVLQLC